MIESISERRRHPRVEASVPIEYKNLKNLEVGTVGTLAQSVSEGGTRFLANEFLPLASRLVIEIFLPAMPRPVKALSKVAWIRRVPMQDRYQVGNQFLDISKEDKKQLANFVSTTISAGTY